MADLYAEIPERAMAVYAHPADAEIACGATLARWAAKGCRVSLIVCARGDKGSHDPDANPDTVAAARSGEVAAAAETLGLASHEVLGYLDGDVTNSSDLREALVARIREWRPTVVCSHDPTAVFFGSGYVNHRDHREVGFAVLDAVSPASASPLYFPAAGSPHRVATLLLTGTLEPDTYIDVAAHLPEKVTALRCHGSQLGESIGRVDDLVRQRAAEGAGVVGLPATEVFRKIMPSS